MASEVLLPRQGNSVESCIILEWKKNEGDSVAEGEVIAEVETDKATFEVESTAAGVLLSRLVSEGDDVPVLAPIALVGEAGEKPEPVQSPQSGAGEAGAPQSSDKPAPAKAPAGGKRSGSDSPARRTGRTAISPRARKLADSRGIGYEKMTGTGPGGRIMVRDVEAAAESGGGSAAPAAIAGPAGRTERGARPSGPAPAGAVEEIPVAGVRKVIARRMLESLTTTAQFTMNATADARELLDYRSRLKASDRDEYRSISINDLLMFAVARTLTEFPEVNATYTDDVIRRYSDVNLGFAVDTERGLMVPVIRGANRLSLVELAGEAHRLAEICKSGKPGPGELAGGTFSVTNLGAFGVQSFTPVLNPPQVGILGIGSIEPRPQMAENETVFVPSIGLSLTINHQVVDGAPGARFLRALAGTIAGIDLTLAR